MKGDVEGANWIFLLPNFEFERVFCIGLPTVTTLTTLSRFSKHVYVVCVNHKELEEFIVLREQSELSNLQAIVVSQLRHLPIKNGSVELILIADQRGINRFSILWQSKTSYRCQLIWSESIILANAIKWRGAHRSAERRSWNQILFFG
jgi:hypothetical protein